MEIQNIKINNYGKLNNKNLDLKKINLIYGKNESGKTTLLNFIVNMFYGISKNKNGKAISDYEKFYPIDEKEFSGTINYKLDNNKSFFVFRDFNKKNPTILDENKNDISNEFNIDKKNGNMFFYDQTKVDIDFMNSTVITNQEKINLEENEQNQLLQKIANLQESGDEEVSYKKALADLDKIMLKEVGTDRSQDKPINITKRNITKYKEELEEINKTKNEEEKIIDRIKDKKAQIEKEENRKIIYNEIKELLKQDHIKEEEINAKRKIIVENNNKIEKIKKEKENSQIDKNRKTRLNIVLLFIAIVINIVLFVFVKNMTYNIIGIVVLFLCLVYTIICLKNKKANYDEQIKVYMENNDILNKEIEDENSAWIKELNDEKEALIEKHGTEFKDFFNSNIEIVINNNNEKIKDMSIELQKIYFELEEFERKSEKLAELTELLSFEENQLEELNEKQRIFNIVKQLLEESYVEMKNNISPKFNEAFSKNIERFSNGEYKTVIVNEGIKVQLKNGNFLNTNYLSTGTINQIYLAMRLAVLNELSNEKLPIILDEAFAYFDDDRLEETLKFLTNVDNQVIIFSCTKREDEILKKLGVQYNYIELMDNN